MAEPQTTTTSSMGSASLYAMGASALIQAFGSISITKHNNAIAKSQANIAKLNAETMELQYQMTLHAANSRIRQTTMQAGQVKNRQKAALAASGVAIGVGSAAELTASTDITKEIDVNTIHKNAHAQAWGYRQQAANYKGQAYMAQAQKRGIGETFGVTLLQGAGQMGLAYLASTDFKKADASKQGDTSASSAPATTASAPATQSNNDRWGLKPSKVKFDPYTLSG